MRHTQFKIICEPKSLQTDGSRMVVIKGKPRFFPNKEAQMFMAKVKLLLYPHRPAAPFTGPVRTTINFVMPRPARLDPKKFPDGRIYCDVRPDLTNLEKGFEDLLTKSNFWLDDGQVASKRHDQWYAARGERPCIEVLIESLASEEQSGLPL